MIPSKFGIFRTIEVIRQIFYFLNIPNSFHSIFLVFQVVPSGKFSLIRIQDFFHQIQFIQKLYFLPNFNFLTKIDFSSELIFFFNLLSFIQI